MRHSIPCTFICDASAARRIWRSCPPSRSWTRAEWTRLLKLPIPSNSRFLGYQHNKPFNGAIMDWRSILFPQDQEAVYEFPRHCGSSFRFKIRRSPVFGEIGLPQGGPVTRIPAKSRLVC